MTAADSSVNLTDATVPLVILAVNLTALLPILIAEEFGVKSNAQAGVGVGVGVLVGVGVFVGTIGVGV